MRVLIGVDIGTQGSKGALISETGLILASCSIEHNVSSPRPGWAEHDADRAWWGGFVEVVRLLLLQSQVAPHQIAGVGVSGLMPVMLPVDADGRPLRPAILYADTRAHAEMVRMNEQLASSESSALVAHDVGPKIVWFRDHEPARWQRIHSILSTQGYVIAKLTGRYVIDSFSAMGMRPFINLPRNGWDVDNCDRFGVAIELLPEIVGTTDVVGTITEEAAAETGLAVGTLVIGGAADFIAETISTGAATEGDVAVSYGTTLCLTAFSRRPIGHGPGFVDMLQHHQDLSRLYPGLYAVGAGMATSGALTRWFRDQFGQTERRVEQELGVNAYELLGIEAAKAPPGADGLIVLPYFSGERSPIHDDWARGVIFGLTLAHGRGHLYRALLEGVAYGLQHNLELMRDAGITPNRIVATGGGSRSHLWTQIVSDVTGLPQEVAGPSNAALGMAFLAGYSSEIFSQISDVGQWVRPERVVHPRAEIHDLYQKYYAVYRRLYEQTKEEMHDVVRISEEALTGPPPPAGSSITSRAS